LGLKNKSSSPKNTKKKTSVSKKIVGKTNPRDFRPGLDDLKTAPARAKQIFPLLLKAYPDAKIELDYKNPLELLVATVLSAQCTDERVNLVTRDLFKKYRKATDYTKVTQQELEEDIKSTGFFRNKARNIQSACKDITEKFKGKVPDNLEDLTSLAGVGRKTANVILGNAYGIPGITTDTHVIRLSRLLGLSDNTDPVKLEFDLMKLIPQKDWTMFSHLLIFHGRRLCIARKPGCENCTIRKYCCFGLQTAG